MKSIVSYSLGVLLVVLTFTSCVQAKKFTIKDSTSNKVCAIVEIEFEGTVNATKDGRSVKSYTFTQMTSDIKTTGICGEMMSLSFDDNTAKWNFEQIDQQIDQTVTIYPGKMFPDLDPEAQTDNIMLTGLNVFKLGDKPKVAYQCSEYTDASTKKGKTYAYKMNLNVKSIKIQMSEVKDEKFSTDVVKCPNNGTKIAGGLMATLAAIVALAVKSS